jgi:hypothetical protein
MNRHYQSISQFSIIASIIAGVTIAGSTITPALAQNSALQPRRGDANRLRPAQGQPIYPTNTDQFSPSTDLPSSNLTIQKINLEVGTVEPVIPGNYNATPQKVNKLGSFSSDPLNAIPIFQETTTPRRN